MAALIGKTHLIRIQPNVINLALSQLKWGSSMSWSGLQHARMISSSGARYTNQGQDSRDPEPFFLNPKVRRLLERVTSLNVAKSFRPRLGRISNPSYKLLTKAELEQLNKETEDRAQTYLQMPPVLKIRTDEAPVINEDPEIDQFETDGSRYVFTDITFGIPKTDRTIVIRNQDGTLRHGSPKERERYLDVYYPRPGKMYTVPNMFRENLQTMLENHKYEYVLDRACLQFEPDDAEYVTVTQRVYEHVAQEKRFDDLRSTRHFGPMTFYFVFYRNIDALLLDMLDTDLLDHAGDLVRLYHIINPDCDSIKLVKQGANSVALVKAYAKSKDSTKSGEIELSLQALTDDKIKMQSS